MQLDVCIEMLFTDLPAEQRIERVAAAGYDAVEFWLPDDKNLDAVRDAAQRTKTAINNMVVNGPGAPLLGVAAAQSHYVERVGEVIAMGQRIDCRQAITCTCNDLPGVSYAQTRAAVVEALAEAADLAARHDFVLLLEPLNTRLDHKGYFLGSLDEGAEIVREIQSPGLKLLFDIYHVQVNHGDLIRRIEQHFDVIGHFHAAGVPGRHELFGTEINYPAIVRRIEALGYTGRFGLEYSPALVDHSESLRQNRNYLLGA